MISSANYGFYLNKDVFDSVYPSRMPKLLINKETVKATFVNGIPCGFDIENEVMFKLLAEIAFAEHSVNILTSPGSAFNSFITDSVPDLFSFGFSLQKLENKFGKESQEMKCAVGLVDEAMKKLVTGLQSLYHNSVLVEGVFVEHSPIPASTIDVVKNALPAGLVKRSKVGELYPNVYLTEKVSEERKEKLASSLNKFLSPLSLEAEVMPEVQYLEIQNSYKLAETLRATTTNISETATFQIVLWTAIGLGIAAVAASLVMTTIDPSTDQLLYMHDVNHPNPKMQGSSSSSTM